MSITSYRMKSTGRRAPSATDSATEFSPGLLLIGGTLLALMLLTRVTHLGSALQLPSASTAVFFLGGFYLGGTVISRLRVSPFWLFLASVVVADFGNYFAGHTSGFCLTPAYAAMLPAYWLLWQGGRWLARSSATGFRFVALAALSWAVVGSVSYLLRNGVFYWLSGRYPDPNMAQYLERLSQYFLPFVTAPLVYLIGAFALHVALGQVQRRTACA
jgi:hypothetical protein